MADSSARRSPLPFHFYFLLVFLQGLGVVVWLLRIPADPKNALVLGMSASRLVMLAAAIAVAGTGGLSAWKALRQPGWIEALADRSGAWLRTNRRWAKILLLSGLVVVLSGVTLLIIRRGTFYVLAPPLMRGFSEVVEAYYVDLVYRNIQFYLDRLQPFAWLTLGLGLQTGLLIPIMAFGWAGWHRRLRSGNIYFFGGLYGAALIAWGLLGGVRLRLEQDVLGWNPQTPPVTDVHLAVAVLLGIGLLLFVNRPDDKALRGRPITEFLVIAGLFLGALLYWQSIPLQPSWFLSPPRPPNDSFYPASDALIYDRTAVSLSSGSGFRTYSDPTIVRRPMYTFFLALLHLVASQDYETVLRLQSAVMAVFPALAYLVTRELSNRLAGILAAVLIILREGAALATASYITISHSRVTMSEFPMAVGIALFILLVFRAMDASPRSTRAAVLAGGVLGAFALVRVEVLVLFAVAFAGGFLILDRGRRRWLMRSGLMLLGVILFLTPWMFRNWQRTGQVYLEIPGNRFSFLFSRMRAAPEGPPPVGPEEEPQELEGGAWAPEQPVSRADPQSAGYKAFFRLETGSSGDPAAQAGAGAWAVLGRIENHFLHSNVQLFLTLPTIFRGVDAVTGVTQYRAGDRFYRACCQTLDYTRRLPYWQWYIWDGVLPVESLPLVFVDLLLLAVGVGTAWKARRWNGLLPLLFAEAYALVLAVARTSGGRYLLPVDWIFVMYFGIGLARALQWGVGLARQKTASPWLTGLQGWGRSVVENVPRTAPKPLAGVLIGVLLVGAVLPLSEVVIPRSFTENALQEGLESLAEGVRDPDAAAIVERILGSGGEAVVGGVYYPRFYASGTGETNGPNSYTLPRSFDRLSFLVIGPELQGVILAVDRFPAVEIPDGVEAVVLGCPADGYLDAALIYFPSTGTVLTRSPMTEDPVCPLPPADNPAPAGSQSSSRSLRIYRTKSPSLKSSSE